jgi:hypothetical protein
MNTNPPIRVDSEEHRPDDEGFFSDRPPKGPRRIIYRRDPCQSGAHVGRWPRSEHQVSLSELERHVVADLITGIDHPRESVVDAVQAFP